MKAGQHHSGDPKAIKAGLSGRDRACRAAPAGRRVRKVRREGELTLLDEIVLGLEQVVSVTAAEQKQQGQVLRTLPDLAAAEPKTRLDALVPPSPAGLTRTPEW